MEEVGRLLAAAYPAKLRMLVTTMYGCGLRVSEATRLTVQDIDGQRMVIRISQSKGHKDRYVPLGDSLLEQLRDYWKQERPTPLLFPGSRPGTQLHVATVREAFHRASENEGLSHLRGMTACAVLDLTGTPINGAGLAHLSPARNLINIKLSETKLTDVGLQHVGRMTSLKEFDADSPRITDNGLKFVQNLKELQQIEIEGISVTSAGIAHLTGLNKLNEITQTRRMSMTR